MTKQLYQIIWGNSTSDLSQKVNQALQFGWKLSGGISSGKATTLGKEREILLQALFRED